MAHPSNYESIAETYGGRAANEIYGLPDYTFSLEFFPSVFNVFFYKGRSDFIKMLAFIINKLYFYIQLYEKYNLNLLKKRIQNFCKILKYDRK